MEGIDDDKTKREAEDRWDLAQTILWNAGVINQVVRVGDDGMGSSSNRLTGR